jgi:hypothetical protein
MSDSNANAPSEGPRPGDQSWSGLPDVPWYTPEEQPSAGQAPPYQYGMPPRRGVPLVNKPKSHMLYAILATLFCCLPFGIVAIVYAAQVDTKWNVGDWRGAERSSRSAKNWALASVIGGLVGSVFYILLITSVDITSTSRF